MNSYCKLLLKKVVNLGPVRNFDQIFPAGASRVATAVVMYSDAANRHKLADEVEIINAKAKGMV